MNGLAIGPRYQERVAHRLNFIRRLPPLAAIDPRRRYDFFSISSRILTTRSLRYAIKC